RRAGKGSRLPDGLVAGASALPKPARKSGRRCSQISLYRLPWPFFWPCFTAPTFQVFRALACGMLAATGRRTVCGMLVGAGLSRVWPHDRAHRFFIVIAGLST
ncbi:hypothetical protein, partial [Frankia sp. CcWB2]